MSGEERQASFGANVKVPIMPVLVCLHCLPSLTRSELEAYRALREYLTIKQALA